MIDKIRVLLIEDDQVQRKEVSQALRNADYLVKTAGSGKTALNYFQKESFDIVLCDLNLPDIDGLKVLTTIRKRKIDLPLIMITAHGTITKAVDAIKEGAQNFVLKPFDINQMKILINQTVENYRLLKGAQRSEDTLKLLNENVPDVIYSLNPSGEFISLSPAVRHLLEYEPEELLGKSVFEIIHPEDRQRVLDRFTQAVKKGEKSVKTIEFRMINKSGKIKDFEIRRKLYFENDKVIRNDGIARDVTERKQLEKQLKAYSDQLEARVKERTQKLEFATAQLESLNKVANKFAQIYDEETLLEEIPSLLTESLEFDRVALYFKENGNFHLKSHNLDKESLEICLQYLDEVNKHPNLLPRHLMDCLEHCQTVFIPDMEEIDEWSDEFKKNLNIKSIVIAPIRVKGKTIGILEGDMSQHAREMDEQDVARFEMFANMVGLALDNIRAYQNLETKVEERTASLNEANKRLKDKAKELEMAGLELGYRNIQMLEIQEELEKKNAEMGNLLTEISHNKDVLQLILDSSLNVIIMVDKQNKILASNKMTKSLFGLKEEEVLNRSFHDFIQNVQPYFEDGKQFDRLIRQLQAKPDSFAQRELDIHKFYERSLKLKAPHQLNISIICEDVIGKKGQKLGRLWSFVDITPMKKADEILRAIVEVSPIPFIISRLENGEVLYANKPLADLIGIEVNEVVGLKTPNFYANPQDREIVLKKIAVNGFLKDYEVQIKKSSGEIIWMIMSLVKSQIEAEPVVIGALYDINERRIAEEALRKERNFISTVLETLGALVIVLDPQGRVIRFNKACEKLTEWKFFEVEGKKFWDLFLLDEEIETVKSIFEDLKSGQFPNEFENYWKTKSGQKKLIAWSNTAIADTNGKVEFIIGTGIDITERKAAEEKQRLYREIFLNSNDSIAIFDPKGKFVERNPAHKRFSGFSDTELKDKNLSDLLDKNYADLIRQMLKEKGSYRGEISPINKNGKRVDIDLSVFPIHNKDSELDCYVGIARDISERKKAEEALKRAHDDLERRVQERTKELAALNEILKQEIEERKHTEEALKASEANNRALLNAIPDVMFRMDKVGNYLDYQAPQGSEFYAHKNEIIGKNIFDILPRDLSQKVKRTITKAIRTKETQISEFQISPLNELRDFEARIVVTGKNEVLGIVRDITEQKRAKEALQRAHDELEERVRERTAELANTNDKLKQEISERIQAEKNLENRLSYEEGLAACSRTLLQYDDLNKGFSIALEKLRQSAKADRVYIFQNFEDEQDGLCMKQIYEVCAKGVKPEIDNPLLKHLPYKEGFMRWQRNLSKGKPIRGLIKNFPESERTALEAQGILSILVLPIWVEDEWFGFIGFDDVLSEERVWDKEDIRLLQTAAEIIGTVIAKNKAENALQVSEERFRSLVENAHDIIYSTDKEGNFSYLSPQFREYTGYYEKEFIGKTLEPLMHPEDLLRAGKPWESTEGKGKFLADYEYRIHHKDGSWRWFTTHSAPIRDEDGNILETVGIAHDVTDMKKILESLELTNQELRDTQSQLVQSEKMASLGMLVAGIAHEINTPIGAISSMHNTLIRAVDKLKVEFAENYKEVFLKNKRFASTLNVVEDANKVIKSAIDRVTNIVRRLRSFARLDEAELKDADIHEGIEDTLTIVHHEIKHHIDITKDFGQIPRISCYPSRLNQVFLNLFINAKQAIQDKGEINIKTYQKDKQVFVEIKDNGVGIPPENLKKIFDPGYTTKGVGVGTGLGLAIVYQIMEDHQGEIKVESDVGKGTKFTIILPTDLDERLEHT